VLVEVVLIDPVDGDNHNKEEEDKVGNLEDVERVETPNIESDHQLELYGKRGRSHLLVQTLLTVLVRLRGLTQQTLSLLLIQSVLQVQKSHQDAHQHKRQDSRKELFQLHVLGDGSSQQEESGRCDQEEEIMENSGCHDDEV
jgi:hypothetical protein